MGTQFDIALSKRRRSAFLHICERSMTLFFTFLLVLSMILSLSSSSSSSSSSFLLFILANSTTTTTVETSTTATSTTTYPPGIMTTTFAPFPQQSPPATTTSTSAPPPPDPNATPTINPDYFTPPPTTIFIADRSELWDHIDIQFDAFFDSRLQQYLQLFLDLSGGTYTDITKVQVKNYMGFPAVFSGDGFVMTISFQKEDENSDYDVKSIQASKEVERKLNDVNSDRRISLFGISSARRVGQEKRLTEDNFSGVDYIYLAIWVGTAGLVCFSVGALLRKRTAEAVNDDEDVIVSSSGGMRVPEDDTDKKDDQLLDLLDKKSRKFLEQEVKAKEEIKFAPSADLFASTLEYENRIKLPPRGATLAGKCRRPSTFQERDAQKQEEQELLDVDDSVEDDNDSSGKEDKNSSGSGEKNSNNSNNNNDQLILNEEDLKVIGNHTSEANSSPQLEKGKKENNDAASTTVEEEIQKAILETLGEPPVKNSNNLGAAVDAANTNLSPQANPFGSSDGATSTTDPLSTNKNTNDGKGGQFFSNLQGIEKPDYFVPRFSARAMMAPVMLKGLYGGDESKDYSSVQPAMFLRPAGTLPIGSKEASIVQQQQQQQQQNRNTMGGSGSATPMTGNARSRASTISRNQNQNQNTITTSSSSQYHDQQHQNRGLNDYLFPQTPTNNNNTQTSNQRNFGTVSTPEKTPPPPPRTPPPPPGISQYELNQL